MVLMPTTALAFVVVPVIMPAAAFVVFVVVFTAAIVMPMVIFTAAIVVPLFVLVRMVVVFVSATARALLCLVPWDDWRNRRLCCHDHTPSFVAGSAACSRPMWMSIPTCSSARL